MAFPATFVDLQQDVIGKGRLDADQDVQRVKDWLNSAYYTAVIETNFYETAAIISTPLAANATAFAVPASTVKIEYIVPTGADGQYWGPMDEVTFVEILELRSHSGGTISTGAPSRYAFRSAGAPVIEFWPQAVGGEVLTFYGASLPPPMVADSDQPIIPEPYRQVIAYGALTDAAEFQKDLISQQTWQSQYQDHLQRFRGFTNTRPGSKVAQFRVEGRRGYPRANSVDTGY
jgi:hypothetical protein